jgi:sec-independent protein translocase protein TatB
MFDIGFTELLVIFVVALLVVGPEQLPVVAKKVGLYLGKMRRSFQAIKDEVEQELEIEAVKAQLKEKAMLAEAKQIEEELTKTVEVIKDSDSETKRVTNETLKQQDNT